MSASNISSAIIGASGEHFVMGELLRRGHIAALAPQGAPNMDILIADSEGSRLFAIQVKTRAKIGGDGGWAMSAKHEDIDAHRLFYVFDDLGKPEEIGPDYFVMPARIVAKVVRETHIAWEKNPGKRGQQRSQNNTMRRIRPDFSANYTAEVPKYTSGWMEPFRSAWHYFDQPA